MGFALDKHTVSSTYIGDDENGHARFDTVRTEVGESLFQLKYRAGWDQVEPLAQAVADHIMPKLPFIGLIVPMPASTARARQPVSAIADALGQLTGKPVFHRLLMKRAGGPKLKNLPTREAKDEALCGAFSYQDTIAGDGRHNVLLLDDLYDSGATAHAACEVLRSYPKIAGIYVAALTSKV
ncbi:ComF family protein [Burkholderia arboris]|uniref:ComF family protein n=1 Tax=Burkholderia arboris TaxID=488730 RepID=UPI00210F0F3E|nr:ComF family protein [Burkholderia arboris]UTV53985.1 ComF family protein [Burkholderia arboris]